MHESFDVTARMTIRAATLNDLTGLEWHGMNSSFREVIRRNYERAEAGEIAYLVADLNGFPVGQIQADLEKRHGSGVAIIWALRVMPALQNLGIGTKLLAAVEHLIHDGGFAVAELGVGMDNPRARRLYERLGYVVVSDSIDRWSFTTNEGEHKEVAERVWVMQKRIA